MNYSTDFEKNKYKLESCVWEITLNCCFACKYCGSKAGKARDNELTTSECISIANQLVELGCKRVSLIGGEVFMRNDWNVIASFLHRNGVKTDLVTNGFRMSNQIINEIKDSGIDSIAVSLDSIPEIHNKYRQTGSFERAIDTIRILSENNLPVSVISTINAENVLYLKEFYNYLLRLPIFSWQIQACIPMGNAKDRILYGFDFNNVIGFVSQNLDSSPFNMGVADNIGYFANKEGSIRGVKNGITVFRGCRAGLTSIGIDSCGNVKGCEALYDDVFIEGNLREVSLSSIWNNPKSFVYNRSFSINQLEGKCASCEYGQICKGGCRAYNYFTNNHNLYNSPNCACTTEQCH